MPCSPDHDMGVWDKASPLALVRSDAPPMWIVHGRHDTLLHVEDAAQFAKALRGAGGEARYTELSGGQHAYDICNSALTAGHVRALRHWLCEVASRGQSGEGKS
jgi:acetyl esterase/lipase